MAFFFHAQWKKSDKNCKSKQTQKTSRSKINWMKWSVEEWTLCISMYYIPHDISFKWRIKHSQVVKSSSSNCQKTISVFSSKECYIHTARDQDLSRINSGGGSRILRRRGPTYDFDKLSKKKTPAWNWENFGPGGGVYPTMNRFWYIIQKYPHIVRG